MPRGYTATSEPLRLILRERFATTIEQISEA